MQKIFFPALQCKVDIFYRQEFRILEKHESFYHYSINEFLMLSLLSDFCFMVEVFSCFEISIIFLKFELNRFF